MSYQGCVHQFIDLDYIPQASADTNVLVLSIRASCQRCGPLRCIGVEHGLSTRRPATSADGFVIHVPMVPEFDDPEHERRLAS